MRHKSRAVGRILPDVAQNRHTAKAYLLDNIDIITANATQGISAFPNQTLRRTCTETFDCER